MQERAPRSLILYQTSPMELKCPRLERSFLIKVDLTHLHIFSLLGRLVCLPFRQVFIHTLRILHLTTTAHSHVHLYHLLTSKPLPRLIEPISPLSHHLPTLKALLQRICLRTKK